MNDPKDTRGGSTGTTWVFAYDRGGNILSKKRYAYTTGTVGTVQQTISYTYNSAWKDKLATYNGTTLSYDAIGNLTGDGTWTYTWAGGRQLSGMSKSGTAITYGYNNSGLRVRKTVAGVATNYTLNGKLITHLTKGSDWMHFFYDGQGKPSIVNYNGATYRYLYNLQGDVIGLIDTSGNVVVEYKYDAWGKIIARTGSLASTLGYLNPFRYRGYVYDEETGLYYLRSRYYNPEWGRFINADVLLGKRGALLSHNVFAYCGNDPVIYRDKNGRDKEIVYLYYDSNGEPLFCYFAEPWRIPKEHIDEICFYVEVVDTITSVIDVGKLAWKGLKAGYKASKVTAKALASKGYRTTTRRLKEYAKASKEFIDETYDAAKSEVLTGWWLDISGIVRQALECFRVNIQVSYEDGASIREAEDYEIIEIEMKPYPSRYFIDDSLIPEP